MSWKARRLGSGRMRVDHTISAGGPVFAVDPCRLQFTWPTSLKPWSRYDHFDDDARDISGLVELLRARSAFIVDVLALGDQLHRLFPFAGIDRLRRARPPLRAGPFDAVPAVAAVLLDGQRQEEGRVVGLRPERGSRIEAGRLGGFGIFRRAGRLGSADLGADEAVELALADRLHSESPTMPSPPANFEKSPPSSAWRMMVCPEPST